MLALNLLPWRETKLARERKWRIVSLIAAVVMAVLIIALAEGLLFYQQRGAKDTMTRLTVEWEQLNTELQMRRSQHPENEVSGLITKIQTNQRATQDLLQRIAQLTPAQIYLIGLYRDHNEIILTGRATTPADVLQFAHALAAKVNAIKQLAESNLVSFKIQMQ